jgi:iron complex outermembrane receptor protein
VHRDYFADSDLWAAYGQVTWNVGDIVRLTLGGRYTSEDKDATRVLNVWDNDTDMVTVNPVAPLVFAGAFGIQTEQTTGHNLVGALGESVFTPSGSFQWDATDDVMIYGSVSTGFKSGGFDARANNVGSWEFLEEEAIAYEVGIKSTLWDGRAELNVAAFFTDYDDLQIAQFDGVLGFNVGNAAKTEVSGFEIDGRLLLTDTLNLSYAFGFLDHEFKDFQNGNCYNRQAPNGVIGDQGNQLCDYTGFSGQYTPEFTSSLVLDYARPFGRSMTFEAMLAHNYTAEQNVHVNLDPQYDIDGYSLVDARVGIRGERWSLAVLGKNLLDEDDVITYAGNTPLSGSTFGTNTFYGFIAAPLTVTVQATFDF